MGSSSMEQSIGFSKRPQWLAVYNQLLDTVDYQISTKLCLESVWAKPLESSLVANPDSLHAVVWHHDTSCHAFWCPKWRFSGLPAIKRE